MKHSLFTIFLLHSLIVLGQFPSDDSIIRKYKIKKTIVTMTTPYQKAIFESIYDKYGKEVNNKETNFELANEKETQYFSRLEFFYRDSFLVHQILRVYNTQGDITDSSLIEYKHSEKKPYRRLYKSTRWSNGKQELEQYWYNPEDQLDSILSLSNDSSYENGMRNAGVNLFYNTLRPFRTPKYLYNSNRELLQSLECDNYSFPLYSPDSIGCKKIVYSKSKDTIIQHISTWYRNRGKETTQYKLFQKNNLPIYEETEYGEKVKISYIKDKRGLIIEQSIITYPPGRKSSETKIKFEYLAR
jgi:hypothetical protein